MKIPQSTKCWLDAGSSVARPQDDFGGKQTYLWLGKTYWHPYRSKKPARGSCSLELCNEHLAQLLRGGPVYWMGSHS